MKADRGVVGGGWVRVARGVVAGSVWVVYGRGAGWRRARAGGSEGWV